MVKNYDKFLEVFKSGATYKFSQYAAHLIMTRGNKSYFLFEEKDVWQANTDQNSCFVFTFNAKIPNFTTKNLSELSGITFEELANKIEKKCNLELVDIEDVSANELNLIDNSKQICNK